MCEICMSYIRDIEKTFGHKVDVFKFIILVESSPISKPKIHRKRGF